MHAFGAGVVCLSLFVRATLLDSLLIGLSVGLSVCVGDMVGIVWVVSMHVQIYIHVCILFVYFKCVGATLPLYLHSYLCNHDEQVACVLADLLTGR